MPLLQSLTTLTNRKKKLQVSKFIILSILYLIYGGFGWHPPPDIDDTVHTDTLLLHPGIQNGDQEWE